MKLLIDGDLFCYRCSAAAEADDEERARYYIDQLLDNCITDLRATEFKFYLTGSTNFRFQIYPEYKANRLDVPKPRHLPAMREYLVNAYNAIVSDGCEADDLLGVDQDKESGTTTIVSLDKDLLMIPGNHYSWYIEGGPREKRWVRPAKETVVAPIEGLRHFYTQMLLGDPSDNIKGVKGIGKVKASAMLAHCTTEQEMFDVVYDAYGIQEEMLMNGQVLWIWQKPNDIWKFPFETREI